jgi:hypothetical protein
MISHFTDVQCAVWAYFHAKRIANIDERSSSSVPVVFGFAGASNRVDRNALCTNNSQGAKSDECGDNETSNRGAHMSFVRRE